MLKKQLNAISVPGPTDNLETVPFDFGDVALLPESPAKAPGPDLSLPEAPAKVVLEVLESPTGSTAPTVHFSPAPPVLGTPSVLGMEDGIPFTQPSPLTEPKRQLLRAHPFHVEDLKVSAATDAAMRPPSSTPKKQVKFGTPGTPVKALPEPREVSGAAAAGAAAAVSPEAEKPASELMTPELLEKQDMVYLPYRLTLSSLGCTYKFKIQFLSIACVASCARTKLPGLNS